MTDERVPGYVIHKRSRSPGDVSYDGPTWDKLGIRDRRQDVYVDRHAAQCLAIVLSGCNPVGFDVSPCRPTYHLNPDAIAEEAERIGAAFQAMEHSTVAELSAEGVEVSFHGDGCVTGSHSLKAEEAAHAILDLGRKAHGPLWQSIETAPKDGTHFLAYGTRDYGYTKIMAVMNFTGGCLSMSHVDGWEYDVDLQRPSHWMSLPEPPEAP